LTNSVAIRSADSDAMVALSAKGRALMGGSTAMRAAGQTYLPKFTAESEASYSERLGLSWLFNGYRKTVRDMTGRVFDKPVALDDAAPQRLKEWESNIDLAGNDLSTFARRVFDDGMSGPGISYIMVDAPARGGTVTQAQARAQNLRPFLVHLRAEDILGWKTETIDNVTVLSQIRIMESVTESDPKDEFAEVKVDQIRVLDRTESNVQIRIYRKQRAGNGRDEWALYEDGGNTGLSEITVVPFYANRTGFFTGEPMLDDLADVNIAHWQSQSDQRNILHVARVPILFGKGIPDDKTITVSTSTATLVSDPQADLKWVEHSGQAIGAGRQDLKDLEFQMEAYGLQLLAAKGNQSATGEALDAKKETSTLSMTADALQDALEQAMIYMGMYAGEAGADVHVNKDFGISGLTSQELQVMLQAVNTGNMSRETFLREMVRRGFIAEIDPADEAERIDTEGSNMADPVNGGF